MVSLLKYQRVKVNKASASEYVKPHAPKLKEKSWHIRKIRILYYAVASGGGRENKNYLVLIFLIIAFTLRRNKLFLKTAPVLEKLTLVRNPYDYS